VFGKGQGTVPPAFEEAASKLKPGEISPVVETPYGYDIVKMVEREPARVVPLEEARPRITDFLKQQEAAAFVDSLKAKSKIEIFI
jgi:peptidyl-prolyl cis-trans isomerase C